MTARILNVNDSVANRYFVSRVLTSAGWEVIEAGTGAEGLELARTREPVAVILDIKLPDMSGLEVCKKLRDDPKTAGIIIIQTSATFVTSEGKVRGLESGADQYLTQPFEAVELIAMIKNLLRLRQKERESRETAEALLVADRRKDEFLAMLAHELRNPLSAITMAATLLDGHQLEPRAARLSATIGRQTHHLARLVDDLLDVSRITRGKIQLQTKPFDLGALIRGSLDGDASSVGQTHRVDLAIADEPLWIDGDATRVEQILSNLLSNAVKYSKRGSRITVSLSSTERDGRRFAKLTMRDEGIGIAREHLPAVFDLFFQVDDSLARSQSGLGIGLTMVKRLVEMHGGTIAITSDGVGAGTTITLELPTVPPVEASGRASLGGAHDGGLRVLLVDDNQDSCELYALAFEDAGHHVKVANDGPSGLAMMNDASYDVAIIDIGLPGLDGYQIARRVRARPGAQPLLVALTGYGREEDRKRALDAGFDAHFVKPVDFRTLLREVTTLAERASRLPTRASA